MINSIFSKIESWFVYIAAAIIPFVFLPVLTDAFELGKQSVLLGLLVLGFIFLLLTIFKTGQLAYTKPEGRGYSFSLIAIIAVLLISSLINSPNKLLSIFSPGGAIPWILVGLFFFLAVRVNKSGLVNSLLIGGSILGIISLVFTFAPLSYPIRIPFTAVSLAKFFSPAGSLTSQTLVFLALIPIAIAVAYHQFKESKIAKLIPAIVGLFLIAGGLVGSIYGLTNTPKGSLLPQNISWSIALETMKQGRQAVFGFGPGQYVNAFTTAKPASFNLTPVWDTRFSSASNWYFQLLTEAGLAGLGAVIILAWLTLAKAYRSLKSQTDNPLANGAFIGLLVLFSGLAFLPGSFVTLFILVVLLAIAEKSSPQTYDFKQLGGFIYPLALFPIAFWAALLYFNGRFSLANNYYYQSLVAASANDGIKTYNLQAKAIRTNPYSPTYRLAYAQTNLALANAIVSNPPEGGELTEQDRSNISQLIQQAIAEAKSTVALDPRSAFAWENLAGIYRNLINMAEGADQWTVQSYQQAITLDPLNPRIRLDLGGVYYGQKEYAQAINLFSQSVNLKPDYANALYNLANGFRAAQQYPNAALAYQDTLTLVAKDSDDYAKVAAELEEIRQYLPTPTPAADAGALKPETLTAPENPPIGINPPLEVPQGEPPVDEVVNPEPQPTE